MLSRAVYIAVIILIAAAPALAQDRSGGANRPVFLIGGQYGTPGGLAGTAGILIAPPRPFTSGASPDSSRTGLVVTGSAGTGGVRGAAGVAALALEGPFLTTGFDALVTVARTSDKPRGAAGNAVYVGGEAGLVIMSVRVSAGVAHRTAGTAVGKSTIFTWSVGVQLPLGW